VPVTVAGGWLEIAAALREKGRPMAIAVTRDLGP
jgi:hypothetical protein